MALLLANSRHRPGSASHATTPLALVEAQAVGSGFAPAYITTVPVLTIPQVLSQRTRMDATATEDATERSPQTDKIAIFLKRNDKECVTFGIITRTMKALAVIPDTAAGPISSANAMYTLTDTEKKNPNAMPVKPLPTTNGDRGRRCPFATLPHWKSQTTRVAW